MDSIDYLYRPDLDKSFWDIYKDKKYNNPFFNDDLIQICNMHHQNVLLSSYFINYEEFKHFVGAKYCKNCTGWFVCNTHCECENMDSLVWVYKTDHLLNINIFNIKENSPCGYITIEK
jgi:hypothetical protein